MTAKRLLRRRLESLGLAKRTKPGMKNYKQKHPKGAGWKDLRK